MSTIKGLVENKVYAWEGFPTALARYLCCIPADVTKIDIIGDGLAITVPCELGRKALSQIRFHNQEGPILSNADGVHKVRFSGEFLETVTVSDGFTIVKNGRWV